MKKIQLLIIFLLVLPIALSFSGEGTIYSIESTTIAQQGKTGNGSIYSFRFTLTGFQPGGSAESTTYLANIGWFKNTPPTQPTLTSPDNNTYLTSITMNWTASMDADGDTINYYVLLNGTQICYTTDLNCSNVTSDGFYLWNVTPYDGTDNGTTSLTRQFTYDSTNPLIDFDTGTLANNSYRNQNYIYTNWTFTEANLDNITAYLYNSTFHSINSTTFLTPTYEINWTVTDLNELYYYNVTIYDYATNYNETETRVITLDNTNPSISSVTISGITSNDATVSFTTSEACNYSIIYGFATDSMPYSVNSNTFSTSHSPTFSTLLTYNREYFFNLTVWDNAGNSDTDVDNNFTTLDKPPTGTGSGDTGLPSEYEEPEVIIEPEIIYVNTTNASLIEKITAFLTLYQQTGFGEEIGENMVSKTRSFNSFIMEVRTLKKWKLNKETLIYINLEDLNGNKIDPEKISVRIRDGDGNIVDSAEEVKKLSLGKYIATLKVSEDKNKTEINKSETKILIKILESIKNSWNTITSNLEKYLLTFNVPKDEKLTPYFIEVNTYCKEELGSDILAIEVGELKTAILASMLKSIQKIFGNISNSISNIL